MSSECLPGSKQIEKKEAKIGCDPTGVFATPLLNDISRKRKNQREIKFVNEKHESTFTSFHMHKSSQRIFRFRSHITRRPIFTDALHATPTKNVVRRESFSREKVCQKCNVLRCCSFTNCNFIVYYVYCTSMCRYAGEINKYSRCCHI